MVHSMTLKVCNLGLKQPYFNSHYIVKDIDFLPQNHMLLFQNGSIHISIIKQVDFNAILTSDIAWLRIKSSISEVKKWGFSPFSDGTFALVLFWKGSKNTSKTCGYVWKLLNSHLRWAILCHYITSWFPTLDSKYVQYQYDKKK